MQREWHTAIDAVAGKELDFRGFYGEYEICAEANGRSVTAAFRVSKNSDNVIVIEV